MEIESIWPVMKWVLLVLIAGFIAQFGKAMAQFIMKKAAKKKTVTPDLPAMPPAKVSPPVPPAVTTPMDQPVAGSGPEKAVQTPPQNKKQIKAMVKQQKKAAKGKE